MPFYILHIVTTIDEQHKQFLYWEPVGVLWLGPVTTYNKANQGQFGSGVNIVNKNWQFTLKVRLIGHDSQKS